MNRCCGPKLNVSRYNAENVARSKHGMFSGESKIKIWFLTKRMTRTPVFNRLNIDRTPTSKIFSERHSLPVTCAGMVYDFSFLDEPDVYITPRTTCTTSDKNLIVHSFFYASHTLFILLLSTLSFCSPCVFFFCKNYISPEYRWPLVCRVITLEN